MMETSKFNPTYLQAKAPEIFAIARHTASVDDLRASLARMANDMMFDAFDDYDVLSEGSIIRVRDCAKVLIRLMTRRSEDMARFSVARAILDIARGHERPDLTPAFYAELLYLFLGLQGRGPGSALADLHLIPSRYENREAALERSLQLDDLYAEVNLRMAKYISGLDDASVERRQARQQHICSRMQGSTDDWNDWNWQVDHILREPDEIARLLTLSDAEYKSIQMARANRLPFGITPYYLSLMDDAEASGHDRAIRAQVMPSLNYVEKMAEAQRFGHCLDFMLEADTSPIDLITRRYPSICIFKPFNTCPQICVYCQRNWEIDDAMEPGAMASQKKIDAAVEWIRAHPAIHEVLVTGGDPLAMSDSEIDAILSQIAAIPTVERIRIGSRTPVTLPMRITDALSDILARYRENGRRQVALVTHAQHSYEITPDTAAAVNRLRTRGIPVYNQLVYTFFASRRFEAAFLRRTLTRIGIDPYYTFNTKGKEETMEYRVPIARLLQEQKEETRLLPGLSRTDEAVYNVPGLGKNYLRANVHRDLISILPDGSRLYEFHPWEKNISRPVKTHLSEDVPILDYLIRLDAIGENVHDYETIWYYY
ncbi:radical SAM protein [Desulfosarcina ovata subsp. sediminis]|uniref:Radical SAM protein n=1 Tax=Desulfosarcina ovata subsp. sediminis TaxID=885957 RepID=A0A5K7ZXU8_9BACT|nr:KamA family radical SAM protein [Desulfosarcina ovata]BBO85105.1 radical SAM protein [Desulfosarcina ovata subsp. sediminis]